MTTKEPQTLHKHHTKTQKHVCSWSKRSVVIFTHRTDEVTASKTDSSFIASVSIVIVSFYTHFHFFHISQLSTPSRSLPAPLTSCLTVKFTCFMANTVNLSFLCLHREDKNMFLNTKTPPHILGLMFSDSLLPVGACFCHWIKSCWSY